MKGCCMLSLKYTVARQGRTVRLSAQVANTRPVGGIRPSTLFYPAWHLVSTSWQ